MLSLPDLDGLATKIIKTCAVTITLTTKDVKMKRKGFLQILILTLIFGFVLAEETKLMEPPSGYTWARCPEIKGAFLQPTGWFFKSSKVGESKSFFITKEEIKDKQQFTTGLSIFVMPNIPKKHEISPYKYSLKIREAAKESHTLTKEWEHEMGPFKAVGFIYTKKDKKGDFTVHNLVISNDKTGTMYLITFEAPTAEWEQAWKTAEPMLKYLFIDDSI